MTLAITSLALLFALLAIGCQRVEYLCRNDGDYGVRIERNVTQADRDWLAGQPYKDSVL